MPFNANWYDAVVVVVVGYGVWSGIRRGLTGEIVGIIGLVLTVGLAVWGYERMGTWLHGLTGWAMEVSEFVGFISIAVGMYLITCAVRLLLRRRSKQQRPLAAAVESVGGAIIGLLRMTAVMAAVTVALCLTRSELWHEQLGQKSRFGSVVVHLVPDIAEAIDRESGQEIWFMRELKRLPEPGIEDSGTNAPVK